MTHFLYPVVEPSLHPNDNENCYVGCFITADENDACLKDQKFVFSTPDIVGEARTAVSYAVSYAESEIKIKNKSSKNVYHHISQPVYDESMGLAYLLAKMNCSLQTYWESNGDSQDILCTGTISKFDNKPILNDISQNEFQTKLSFFIKQSEYNLFIIPELNLDTNMETDKNEEKIHFRQLLKDKNIHVLTLAEFSESRNIESSQKIVVTVANQELLDLIHCIFPKEKKSPYYTMASCFIFICCILAVCLTFFSKPNYYDQLQNLEIELNEKFLLDTSLNLEFGHSRVTPYKYSEATLNYKKALKKLPKDDKKTKARALKLMGDVAFRCGLYSKSQKLLKDCLTIRKNILPEEDDSIADTYYSLALLYNYQGKFKDSMVYYKNSLSIYEKKSVIDNSKITDIYANIADLYQFELDYNQSEIFFQKALKISKYDHQKEAEILIQMAFLYFIQGFEGFDKLITANGLVTDKDIRHVLSPSDKYKEVESLIIKALNIYERIAGKNSIPAIEAQMLLAIIYDLQNKKEKAEPLYKSFFEIINSKIDKDPSVAVRSLSSMLILWNCDLFLLNINSRNLTKIIESKSLCNKTLNLLKKEFGENHILIACAYNIMAKIYIFQGQYNYAKTSCSKALEIFKKELGEDHLLVAETMKIKAAMYSGEYSEELYSKVLIIYKKELGENSPFIIEILYNLAMVLEKQGEFDEAEDMYTKALSISENVYGKYDPPVVEALIALERFYERQKNYSKAEPLYMRLLKIYGSGREYKDFSIYIDFFDMLDKFESMIRGLYGRSINSYEIEDKVINIQDKVLWIIVNRFKDSKRSSYLFDFIEKLVKIANDYKDDSFHSGAVDLLFKKSLEVTEDIFKGYEQGHPINGSSGYPIVSDEIFNINDFYINKGKYEEILPLFNRIIEIYANHLEKKDYSGFDLNRNFSNICNSFVAIYRWYYTQSNYQEAELLYKKFLKMLRTLKTKQALFRISSCYEIVINALEKMADDYNKQCKHEISKLLYNKISEIYKETYGKDYKVVLPQQNCSE